MDLSLIIKALTERNRNAPDPGGMVGQAAGQLVDRPYQIYAQEATANGQKPLPIGQWQASRSK
jgi:hypothetical protein